MKINGLLKLENKLVRRFSEEEIQDAFQLRGEKTKITKMRKKISNKRNEIIANEINDVEIYLFLLREIEKANDIFRKS